MSKTIKTWNFNCNQGRSRGRNINWLNQTWCWYEWILRFSSVWFCFLVSRGLQLEVAWRNAPWWEIFLNNFHRIDGSAMLFLNDKLNYGSIGNLILVIYQCGQVIWNFKVTWETSPNDFLKLLALTMCNVYFRKTFIYNILLNDSHGFNLLHPRSNIEA